MVDDVVHYCVGNMPGAVPRTSTYALTNVTLPYVLAIAGAGVQEAVHDGPGARARREHVGRGGDERGCGRRDGHHGRTARVGGRILTSRTTRGG